MSEQIRTFKEIVVEYPPEDICTYPEYKGKPYYGIKYVENEEDIIGYGTYNPKVLSEFIRDYFIEKSDNPSGRWIIDDATDTRIWECHCSVCGYNPQNDIGGSENWWLMRLPKFCSNCGAKMSSDEGE